MGKMNEWIIELIVSGAEWFLDMFVEVFNTSLDVISVEVGKTPMDFSPAVVNTLKTISSNVITPIAGIILTYIFVHELMSMILEKNNMVEFETFSLFKVIMKTTLAILLVTNSFDITLAFFDVGKTLVQGVRVSDVAIKGFETSKILASASENFGVAIGTFIISFVAWAGSWVGTAMIYLIVWSRIVTILVYVSVAPIPFATLMNKDWIGHIGQNYLKNLMSYALQGFLMMITLVIYSALITNVSSNFDNSNVFLGVIMLLVTMFVCVKTLMGALNLAKSIFGAS